jgi:tetratricopeptide (TPR) repeat protein
VAEAADQPAPEVQARFAELVGRLQAGEPGALADLEEFSADHPDLAGPLVGLGIARSRDGDEAAARDFFERATRVCARCGPAWNELGVLARQQGRFADAEQAYLKAVELQPGFAPAHFNLAMLYELYMPRPELALQNYERYLELAGPGDAGADVEKWVADLRRRVGDAPTAARSEPAT